ncbi:prolyl oligopeptidase [Mesoflavibacter sabulilitoris]|uniref:prolyl oligopeptidase n=1 Tax=Mesoflavibacter zeaxanthinifaciens subsp. sabulilitoris TaxID=1520893 RepID=A0A2T1N5X6_9FLAO|nr:prolyl oligopeptidase family serine peptidase [Mesoflavibacter zeaxanthinifaciens]MBB3123379.1 prolyl oligopeptidase [Mesoflavibacter zeaxanthinifaciens subsp. sabulilitoris]PSG86989.1 prolyl oligopeptidase [Mesoflavibacter zeaxanthinifaciens subsp. sabulilitoris]
MKKALLFLLLSQAFFGCKKTEKQVIIYNPPSIQGVTAKNNYFGKIVVDPYRNLETVKDSTITNWYKSQTKYSQSFLNRIKGRDSFIKKTYELDNRKSFLIRRHHLTENNNRYYLKKNIDKDFYRLFFKRENDPEETLLFDPRTYKESTNNEYEINYIKPSWDEKYIVVSLSYSGKELSELIIIDINTKKQLPVVLENAWPSSYLGINWLPDSSGFTYLYFPNSDSNSIDFKKNNQSVLYTLGQDAKKLNYIFGNRTHPELNILATEHPTTSINSSNDKYLIGYLSGVDNFWDAYYAKINDIKSGKLNWKPLYKKEDKVKTSRGLFVEGDFIFMSGNKADNFKLASVNVNDLNFDNPKVLFEEKDNEVIETFRVNKNAIYLATSKYGIESFLYEISSDNTKKIELPKKAGSISLSHKSINYDDLWVTISGWTSSYERYKYDSNTNTFKEDYLTDKIEYPEFKNIIVEEISVPSYDGVLVPLSIIYDKNINKNGKNPLLLFGYGAYGDGISPFFSPIFLQFINEGGILCVPHVRGGGEKGEEWRKGGFKTTKSNTWKDLIACTEYLINNNFTSKEKTAIYSGSAGGIMVGRAMTERPDLFSVVISEAGVLNPIRMEVQPNAGGSNIREFGNVKDSVECKALIEMDAYLHIEDSVDYPATYLTVGMNDPRVVPWESGKFAARLQNSNKLKKPVLLYADFNTGHSGSSDKKMYEEWGNVFSFLFWQTGHPDYQLIPIK